MGGLAGHMSHLYENPRLTFNKLKEIFQAAAEGEIEGTEKTDGQNLYLSFSVPDQKMEFTDDDGPGRAARNKTNIKSLEEFILFQLTAISLLRLRKILFQNYLKN